jgi:AraC-like DNA-binding protein
MNSQPVPLILVRFAQALGTNLHNHRLVIPNQFGQGYCSGYVLSEHIRLLIADYELYEDLPIENPEVDAVKKTIFFKFQHVFPDQRKHISEKPFSNQPAVLIGTSRIDTDDMIAIHTNTSTINIEVDAGYLNSLFNSSQNSPVLKSLLENTQPLLFEQIIHPTLQTVVNSILSEPVNQAFELFFLKIKAEELVCRLLMELEKRDEQRIYSLNSRDIQTIYTVREQILNRLDTPPVINQLAFDAGMSPTKLKRLFKQVFGDSIFSYYQNIRMQEAARLLREEKLSVSETGYRLGFTNLSHFSRVFQEHMDMKPKQYSRS